MNAKLFQIRLLKRVLKREKKGVLDCDSRSKPDSRTCERKALSERDSCKILPRSAQILIVIGKAVTMHVNAHSSNHDPNHVLDRDPKRLSERDSSPCEHSHCKIKQDKTRQEQMCSLLPKT